MKHSLLMVNLQKKHVSKGEKSNKEISQNRLEEYRQLRAEIRTYLDRRSQNSLFSITITLGVIGVGFQFNNYLLFFAAFLLIVILWFDEIRRIRAVFRTAAYIEIIIEKSLKGLSWETLSQKHKFQENHIGRLISNALYPVLAFLNVISGILILDNDLNIKLYEKYLIFLAQIVLIIIMIIYSYYVGKYGSKKELNEWGKILAGEK